MALFAEDPFLLTAYCAVGRRGQGEVHLLLKEGASRRVVLEGLVLAYTVRVALSANSAGGAVGPGLRVDLIRRARGACKHLPTHL